VGAVLTGMAGAGLCEGFGGCPLVCGGCAADGGGGGGRFAGAGG
jgi:hypothetical protein